MSDTELITPLLLICDESLSQGRGGHEDLIRISAMSANGRQCWQSAKECLELLYESRERRLNTENQTVAKSGTSSHQMSEFHRISSRFDTPYGLVASIGDSSDGYGEDCSSHPAS